jgi:hypothetical protein
MSSILNCSYSEDVIRTAFAVMMNEINVTFDIISEANAYGNIRTIVPLEL